jgi:hypothetical protein
MSTLIKAFEKALIEQMHWCPQEVWDCKSQELKNRLIDALFFAVFEIYFKRGRIALFGSVETLGSEGNPEPFCG